MILWLIALSGLTALLPIAPSGAEETETVTSTWRRWRGEEPRRRT